MEMYPKTVKAYGGKTSDRYLWRRSSNYAYGGNESGGRPLNIEEYLGGAFVAANVPQV
eukprot:CAMPEP_0172519264 /NCGR_PEP_ID=MMETSP1066-20121228/291310_1 /TAXON_ID=671091 /ORGANISM="Coscinodiscus wailesii, Strain CCMP2513" /LENGTH=57 /DNA_ID=CAMNT_0013301821 /DNA_START=1205 /DNA_END=1378 /DNA_ORIENTATION=-